MDEQGFRWQSSAVISVKERREDNWSLRTQYSSLYSHLLIEDDPLCVKAVVIRDKSGLFKNDLKRVACFSAREPVVRSHCHRPHEKAGSGFVPALRARRFFNCSFHVTVSSIKILYSTHSDKNDALFFPFYSLVVPAVRPVGPTRTSSHDNIFPRVFVCQCRKTQSVFFVRLPRIQSCMSKNMCAGGLRGGVSFHALHISVVWGTNYLSAYLFACAVLGWTIRLCALLRHTPLRASH